MTTATATQSVDAAFEKKADEIVTHYPVSKRSAVLMLLHFWQETFGFISDEGVGWVAQKLDLQKINVLEVVTFYPMFRQKAIGKFHVKVCRTLPCELAGSHKTFEKFLDLIGPDAVEEDHCITSKDGRYTIEFVECLASCGTAPVVMVDDELHERVTEDKAQQILDGCK